MSQSRHMAPMVELRLRAPLLGLAEDHGPDEPIPPHRHDAAQLIHASSGVMTVRTEDDLWVVPPARAVWVPAFVTHSIAMSGRVELRTLYLAPDFAPDLSSETGDRCSVVQVTPLLRAAILRAMDFEYPYPPAGVEANVVAVIRDEIAAARATPLHLPMPADPRARRVSEAFWGDVSERKSVAEWARMAGASERTLERLFQSDVGMSFGRWQRQVRLLRALELLAAGHAVTRVALEVGFDTPSAFIAMFKGAMGTTPARYFDPGQDG